MVKEVLKKRLSGDLTQPPIDIDPWVSCANDLVTDDADIPLSAHAGKLLGDIKLDKTFPLAQTGQVLTIDGNKEAVPKELSDDFVKKYGDQEIDGTKTFKEFVDAEAGISIGGLLTTDNMLMMVGGGEGKIFMKASSVPAPIEVVASAFHDPYDPTADPTKGTKDAKIASLDANKLDKMYPDAQEGQVLTINAEHIATPMDVGLDKFVDRETDQEINGNKTFTEMVTSEEGFVVGKVDEGITITRLDQGEKGVIAFYREGTPTGNIEVQAKTFNDPYDAENDTANSKDKKLTDLETNKLNKLFPDAQEGHVLSIDAEHNVVASDLTDKFVDLTTEQTIAGEKTFSNIVTSTPGYVAGNLLDGLWIYGSAQTGGVIAANEGGQHIGKIKVEAKTFSDPYDASNLINGTKDKKLTDLETYKLDKLFPGATEGQVLTINADGYAEPRNAGSGQFVDLRSDQTIGGNKSFDDTIGAKTGAVVGSPTNGIHIVPYEQEIQFNTYLAGSKGAGTVKVKAVTFSDPYNPNNTADGSKDKKLTDLEDKKLNKKFEGATEGQVLTINAEHEAVPMDAGAGQFVNLTSDQDIGGIKTFTKKIHANDGVSIGEGVLVLEKNLIDPDHATISTVTGTTIDVTAVTFNDPYNKDNANPTSKDAKITSLDEDLGATTNRVSTLESQMRGKSQVVGSDVILAKAKKLKGIFIDQEAWIPAGSEVEASSQIAEGAPTVKSLTINGTDWNLPFTELSTPELIDLKPTGVTTTVSCFKQGNVVFLQLSIVVAPSVVGSVKILRNVPVPISGCVFMGDGDLYAVIASGDITITSNQSTVSRTRHWNVSYLVK